MTALINSNHVEMCLLGFWNELLHLEVSFVSMFDSEFYVSGYLLCLSE